MTTVMEFQGFPKITRLANAECVITEKVDGTNAALIISEDGRLIGCQSRKRMITPDRDNYGFATWAHANAEGLAEFFGPGRHFGEWWGAGIQRRYGMSRKMFSPFNVGRFNIDLPPDDWPADCCPIPVLATCPLSEMPSVVEALTIEIQAVGSVIARGFKPVEGLMIWVSGLGYIKHPFNPAPKGLAA